MFTQRISMDCTKEQYKRYLKDELLKMGYKDYTVTFWGGEGIIVNNINSVIGSLGNLCHQHKEEYSRTYLGSFNAPLFLALAAMTDKAEGNYGEYVIGLETGKFYRMNKDDRILPEYKFVRKATKEEIMAKFGEKSEQFDFTITPDATEIIKEFNRLADYIANKKESDAINLLKSKGYKILKPKTWEEI